MYIVRVESLISLSPLSVMLRLYRDLKLLFYRWVQLLCPMFSIVWTRIYIVVYYSLQSSPNNRIYSAGVDGA